MQAPMASPRLPGNPMLARYLRNMYRGGFWKAIGFHYILVILLVAGGWHIAMSGPVAHPEIIIKLAGVYCFLIGSLIIPLIAPILFPLLSDTDQAGGVIPIEPVRMFDARLLAVILLSAAALFPLLPLFLILGPSRGSVSLLLEIMPFFQGMLTTGWVYLLMEMTGQASDVPAGIARRLALIAGFVFLHVVLVGLLAQLSFVTLQQTWFLKLIIDLNPFSQLFILMEGPEKSRMIVNSDFQNLMDYRSYLLLVSGLVLFAAMTIYRAYVQGRSAVM